VLYLMSCLALTCNVQHALFEPEHGCGLTDALHAACRGRGRGTPDSREQNRCQDVLCVVVSAAGYQQQQNCTVLASTTR
jgi:hypothetical protein